METREYWGRIWIGDLLMFNSVPNRYDPEYIIMCPRYGGIRWLRKDTSSFYPKGAPGLCMPLTSVRNLRLLLFSNSWNICR